MTSADQTLAEIEALLAHLPRLSRPLISRYFRSGFSVEQKPDNSPVTSADRAVEAELRQAIAKARQPQNESQPRQPHNDRQ
ncbi:MAG: hypothetical protein ACPGRU_00405, partial [Candidatus Puniceispirillaceae bacterium]